MWSDSWKNNPQKNPGMPAVMAGVAVLRSLERGKKISRG
jgi:hypothetical protein